MRYRLLAGLLLRLPCFALAMVALAAAPGWPAVWSGLMMLTAFGCGMDVPGGPRRWSPK